MSKLSVQRPIGYAHASTTMGCLHLARGHPTGNTSSLDLLEGIQ